MVVLMVVMVVVVSRCDGSAGGMSAEQAEAQFNALLQQGRYLEDLSD